MKLVNLSSAASRDTVLDALKNSTKINEKVKFDEKRGRPLIKVRGKNSFLYITCEMIGGPTKDNGFLLGTMFLGTLKEKNGTTRLRGVIVTDPIFHLLLIAFCTYFLIQSFVLGGFTILPAIFSLFTLILYKDEYKKQGIIKRFFGRAFRYVDGSGELGE